MKTINNRNYKVISEQAALPNTAAKTGAVKHFTLKYGNQLFTADEYKDGAIKVKKISRSLLSILF